MPDLTLCIRHLGLFLLLAATAVATLYFLRRQLRVRESSEPLCPRCGYIVKGLPSSICPECGVNYRDESRRSGWQDSAGRRISCGSWCAVWSLSIGLVALLNHFVILSAVGSLWAPVFQILPNAINLFPKSGAYAYLSVATATRDTDDGEPAGTMRLVIRGAPSEGPELTVYPPEFKYGFFSPGAGHPVADCCLNPAVLLRWMNLHGVDTTSQPVRDESEDLMCLVSQLAGGTDPLSTAKHLPCFRAKPVSVIAGLSPFGPPWLASLQLLLCILVWSLGLAQIVRASQKGFFHAPRIQVALQI